MNLRTAAIVSAIVTLLGGVSIWQGSTFDWPGNQQGYRPEQPIAFSHKLHVGDNRIPCLYCHSSADRSKVAGIPAASTCMNCHAKIRIDSPEIRKIARALETGRPIAWTKVHDLPDHVVFNHSRHVVAGIACARCHGQVETMERTEQVDPLLMGDCVGCHRQYRRVTIDSAGNPRITTDKSTPMLMASTDCSVCHH